ncbi:MAG: hypothetical protein ABL958_08045 [Bdellovibrionia bacterium]
MKFSMLLVCFLTIFEANTALANYCTYNTYGKRIGCTSDPKACADIAKRSGGGGCLKESMKNDLPPNMKASESKAYCLWIYHSKMPKNLGCMAKVFCDRSLLQYEEAVCVPGQVKDMDKVRGILDAHLKSVSKLKASEAKKKNEKEHVIFSKGSANEIITLIREKFGRHELTTPQQISDASKKIETYCKENNPKACLALFELNDKADFKDSWTVSAATKCTEMKAAYDNLYKSCSLGLREACDSIRFHDEEDYTFYVREPGQEAFANVDAKGIDCTITTITEAVQSMKDKCDEQRRTDIDNEMCNTSKNSKENNSDSDES